MSAPVVAGQAGEAANAPRIIAPAADIFLQRARRFDELAQASALGDWLRYLAALTRAQHTALQDLLNASQPSLPSEAEITRAHEFHMPPVPAQSWPGWQDAALWPQTLRALAQSLLPAAPAPGPAQLDLQRLIDLPATAANSLARRVLHTELYGADAALLSYVAAALQTVWTAAAVRLSARQAIVPLDVPTVCPCCGFAPVAGVLRDVGEVAGLRFLHCALCNTEWNFPRVQCAACEADEKIGQRELVAKDAPPGQPRQPGPVRAETCERCHSYLKTIVPGHGGVDPVADDLSSLALDILMDEAGYARAGPNLLFVAGE